MTPFRPDRRRRGPDRFLAHKMLLFITGAVMGMIGIATDRNWIIYLAVGVLVVGLLLRFLARSETSPDE